MKKLWRKIFSILLACVMAFSLLPVTAWAYDPGSFDTDQLGTTKVSLPSDELAANGLAATAYISYDTTGMEVSLVISITDDTKSLAIPNFDSPESTPWQGYLANLENIYIQEGVTEIGANAFSAGSDAALLSYAEIPSTVTRIGENAFYNQLSAEFSDGSNDGNLDLSSVTEMGEAAFYNCDEITSVTLNGQLNCDLETTDPNYASIPDRAFASCGLTSYTLEGEFGIQRIGNSAFSGNRLNSVTFPDGLVTIGNSAFQGNPFGSMTSLTIPDSVETIGNSAFQSSNTTLNTLNLGTSANSKLETIGNSAFLGNTGLATVVIQSTALESIGDYAFGSHEYNAYTATAVDDEGHSYTVGTQFQTPNDDVLALLDDGVNCYLGQRSPLQLKEIVQPTCEKKGQRIYTFTWQGQQDPQTYIAEIPAVGHKYVKTGTKPATCTQSAYDVYECSNVETERVEECELPQYQEAVTGSAPLGHDYVLTVDNTQVDETTEATFTFTCSHADQGLHDGGDAAPAVISATVPAVALTATTTQNLEDIADQLPDSGKPFALAWNEDQDLNADFTKLDENFFEFTLTPISNRVPTDTITEYGGTPLTIQVNVERTELDFSQVRFDNTLVYVDTSNPSPYSIGVTGEPTTVNNRNTGVTYSTEDDIVYTNVYDSSTSNHAPSRSETWNGTVAVTFHYNTDKFSVDENKKPAGYELTVNEEAGTVTIQTSYTVAANEFRVTQTAISGLKYTGNELETLRLDGVPSESMIVIEWEADDGTNGKFEGTSPSNSTTVNVAPFKEAGTYTLKVSLSKEGYSPVDLEPIEVTIQQQPVALPAAGSVTYDQQPHTGFTVNESAPYTITEETADQNTQTNAGTYYVEFALNDSDNFVWADGADMDADGTITLSWTIAQKTISGLYTWSDQITSQYTGGVQTRVSYDVSGYTATCDEKGTLTVKWNNETVFTVTDAQHTDAGDYTCTAKLISDNFTWEYSGGFREIRLGIWSISPRQITDSELPEISVPSAPYDGQSYDGDINVTDWKEMEEILSLDETTPYRYYTASTGGEALNSVPINAGTYYVEPNWVYNTNNYNIVYIPRTTLRITQVLLNASTVADYEITFSGEGQPVKEFTVRGLVLGDDADDYSIVYTLEKWDATLNDGAGGWGPSTSYEADVLPTVTDVGKYRVSASLRARNYTATFTSYTLTITQGSQSIVLTPDSGSETGWNAQENTMTVTLGEVESFTVTGKGTVNPTVDITYAVTEESDGNENTTDDNVIDVNKDTGEVTVKGAGTATVTVYADETDQTSEASVTYSVTVNRGTAVINRDDISVTYDGEPLDTSDYEATLSAPIDSAPKPTGSLSYAFYTNEGCTEEFTDSSTDNIPSAQGIYYLKISYDGDNNYEAGDKTVQVTINTASLTVTKADYNETYDGADHSLSQQVTVKGLNGETLTAGEDYTIAFVKSDSEPTDWTAAETVGTFKDVADTGIYQYWITAENYGTDTGSISVTVSHKNLTVDISPDTFQKEYDGYPVVEEEITATVSTGIESESIQVISATGTYEDKNAGDGKDVTIALTLSGVNGWGNYSYDGTTLDDENLSIILEDAGSITQKEITVSGIYANDRVYDGTLTVTLSGEPKTDDMVGGDQLTLTLAEDATGTVKSADVGTNKSVTLAEDAEDVVQLGGSVAGNYKIAGYDEVYVDITAATPTLVFNEAEEDVITKSFTGLPVSTENELKVTVSGVPNGTVPTGAITWRIYDTLEEAALDESGEAGEELTSDDMPVSDGEYYIRAFIAAGGNYTAAASAPVTLIISAANLTVETDPTAQVYTGKSYNLKNLAGMTVTGYVDGQANQPITGYKVSFLSKADHATQPEADDAAWEAGITEITDVLESGDYWYRVTYQGFEPKVDEVAVTITPAELTIHRTVDPTREYNGTDNAKTQVTLGGTALTGQQNGENIEVSVTSAVYDSATVEAKKITITYTLTATDADLSNYRMSGESDALATVDGITTAKITEEVIRVEGTQVAITPAPVTVTIYDQEDVYDGQKPEVGNVKDTNWKVTRGQIYQLTSDVDDDLGITLSITEDAKDADTYAISGQQSNTNYNVTFRSEDGTEDHGAFTIEPRPVNVTIGSTSGVYGDDHGAAVDSSVSNLLTAEKTGKDRGLAQGETLTDIGQILLNTDAGIESGVNGSYSIYAVTSSGEKITDATQYGNYMVTFDDDTAEFTVTKRPVTITIDDKNSAYGCGIQELTWKDSYTGGGDKDGIVNDDNLKIDLTTTASNTGNVNAYPIYVESYDESVASNYSITWAGSWDQEDEYQHKAGTYHINKATLSIEFSNKTVNVSIGNTVDNPLEFINTSNNNEELTDKPSGVTVQYESGNTSVATVDENTGEVTIVGTGDAIITAKVTDGGQNFTNNATDSYELRVATASAGIQVSFPNKTLTYTGQPQDLLGTPTVSPQGASIQYRIQGTEEWKDKIPEGTDAGTYYVEWKASATGYSDVSNTQTVVIGQAELDGGFNDTNPQTTFVENGTYGNTENPLSLPTGYNGTVQYYSTDPSVASVDNINEHKLTIHNSGTVTINAVCLEDQNYKGATFFYTLTIGAAGDIIEVTKEEGYTGTYDGQAHPGAVIQYTAPDGAEIHYAVDDNASYPLAEVPTFTDAGAHTVYYQITAPGCTPRTGSVKVNIAQKEITADMFKGSISASYTHTGTIQIQPPVTVTYNGMVLEKDVVYKVSYGENNTVGEDKGSVTVTAIEGGNYTGAATVYFDITPIEGTVMTAQLAPNYGVYQEGGTTAKVTVTHAVGNTSHTVDLTNAQYTFEVTGLDGTPIVQHGASGSGDTLTFNKVGIYNITMTLTGDHVGTFHMTYTLLPMTGDDGELTLTVDGESYKVYTYGDEITDDAIKVEANGQDVTGSCKLTYTYTGFDGTTTSGDYSLDLLKNAGAYTVTATPTDSSVTGTGTFLFLIRQRDLADAAVTVDDGSLVYNQQEQTPSVAVTLIGNPEENADYVIADYYNNIDATADGEPAQVLITAMDNNFTGSKTATFDIQQKDISNCEIAEIPDQPFTGQEVVPLLTVTDNGTTLVLDRDYTTFCDDVGPGEATVTITGIGNYKGTTTKTFTITSEPGPQPTEKFTLTVTPDTAWTYGSTPEGLAFEVKFGDTTLTDYGTQYKLVVGSTEYGSYEEALAGVKTLKPGTYTVTALGAGVYAASSSAVTITVSKAQLPLEITVTPDTKAGGGTATIQVTPGTWPNGIDSTTLTTVTVAKGGVAQDSLELEYDNEAGAYKPASFSFGNENATYVFDVLETEIEGFDAGCYELAVTGGKLTVVQQTGGGVIPVPDEPPVADPDDTGVSAWLNTVDHFAYLGGYPGNLFGPDNNMTRAEAAQMFYNLLLDKDVPATTAFEDVDSDAWYAEAVNALATIGIINGVGDNRYEPERDITRAEFTVMATRFTKVQTAGVDTFSDVDAGDWFYPYVATCVQYGWINGYPDGTFKPHNSITRAEVTTIVNRMLGRNADSSYVDSHASQLTQFVDLPVKHWAYYQIMEAANGHDYTKSGGMETWTKLD